jgi:2-polyprenyl-6-methoxyphenol hydroxylase-like FAD-dependent oxidoreductase
MEHDVITVGGGMAGSALAKALAEAGLRVLVLERETAFRDRVRGEQMLCWGVAEAQALGVHDLLRQACGHEVRHWSTRIAGAPEAPPRDLVETTPPRTAALDFYHPAMQEALLGAAEAAGAEVRRGVAVLGVAPGERPAVRIRLPDGAERTLTARLVVGADGRNSACRGWAGFAVERDPERLVVAGVLLDGLGAPEDRVSLFLNPGQGLEALTVPLGGGRFRSYAAWFAPPGEDRRHLSGRRALGELVARSVAAGAPAAWFARAEAAGPLASFEGADHWVPHPYRDGVALVGDAAAVSDPSFGSGLSLALRDARVLRDRLLAPGAGDWDTAGHAYAAEHDRHYGAIHRIIGWLTTLFCDPRPEAAAVRARALPRLAEDPKRGVDLIGLGPDAPSDEAARRRLFGED